MHFRHRFVAAASSFASSWPSLTPSMNGQHRPCQAKGVTLRKPIGTVRRARWGEAEDHRHAPAPKAGGAAVREPCGQEQMNSDGWGMHLRSSAYANAPERDSLCVARSRARKTCPSIAGDRVTSPNRAFQMSNTCLGFHAPSARGSDGLSARTAIALTLRVWDDQNETIRLFLRLACLFRKCRVFGLW